MKDNLLSFKNDSKKFWRTIHEVVPNNKKKTSKTNLINQTTSTPIPSNEVSNFINNYFASIGADLAKNLNSKWTYEGLTLPQMFNFNLITPDELNKQVCTINVVKSGGLHHNAVKLLISYPSNRAQRTLVNNSLSDIKSLNFGVPQGSILGPLLFLIFINDLPQIINHSNLRLYADDTALYCAHENPVIAQHWLQTDLDALVLARVQAQSVNNKH